MTLNRRKLKKWGDSMRIWFTKEQERLILEQFSEEPWPHEWSEQDIVKGIRQIVYENPRPPTPLPDFLK